MRWSVTHTDESRHDILLRYYFLAQRNAHGEGWRTPAELAAGGPCSRDDWPPLAELSAQPRILEEYPRRGGQGSVGVFWQPQEMVAVWLQLETVLALHARPG